MTHDPKCVPGLLACPAVTEAVVAGLRAATLLSLPPDGEFARPCPWCKRPLTKKHARDEFRCLTCGWKG